MSAKEDDTPTEANLNLLVTSEFKTVWRDYHEREPEACARALSALSVVEPSRPRYLAVSTTDNAAQETHSCPATAPDTSSDDVNLSLYILADEQWNISSVHIETVAHISLPSPCPVAHISLPSPCPVYESCAPLQQNILHGDDPNFMPFLPYADEPTFDDEDHALEYHALAWQESYRDPDTLEIVLETARRLHSTHGLSSAQIDDTNVLPLTLRTTSACGALWTGQHSDPIVWPGSSRSSCALPDIPPPRPEDLRGRLQDYLTLWCPRPDCLQAHCFSHNNVEQFDLSAGVSATPFRCLPATSACGNNCIVEHASASEDDVSWSNQDIDDLRLITQLGEPMSSCDLAGLCRKPCYEIALICKQHDDFYVPPKRQRGRPRLDVVKRHTFGPERAPDFVPKEPCAHRGPCGQSSDCACYLNKAHCSRNCRCARDCSRRWPGCKCSLYGRPSKSKAPQTCSGKHCPCWIANRECDPDVCLPCQLTCRNTQLQKGMHKATEVKMGKFGFGLYLTEDAKKGDLITEYLGELIYEPTFLCRGQVASHVGRSYVFALNESMSVDAFPAGNQARFINHMPSENSNVAVSILLVHGEQRIGVFAKTDLDSGSELYMDYGPKYDILELKK